MEIQRIIKAEKNQSKENPDTRFSLQTENKLMERKEEEEEDIVCLHESFFINDDYQLTKFTFGSQVLELLCLQSASTDLDLTGQLVWPGAILLNDYLSKNFEIIRGCSIIELGSCVGKCNLRIHFIGFAYIKDPRQLLSERTSHLLV